MGKVDIDFQTDGGTIVALFGSMSDTDNNLLVTMAALSDGVTSELSEGALPLVYGIPILEEDWKIDSVEAMKMFLAQEHIQELWLKFPERCSDLSLRRFWVDNRFVLAWVLTISDCLEVNYTYYFYLDPITGEMLDLSY